MAKYIVLMGGSGRWELKSYDGHSSVSGLTIAAGHCPKAAPVEVIGRQARNQSTWGQYHNLQGGHEFSIQSVGLDLETCVKAEAFTRNKNAQKKSAVLDEISRDFTGGILEKSGYVLGESSTFSKVHVKNANGDVLIVHPASSIRAKWGEVVVCDGMVSVKQ